MSEEEPWWIHIDWSWERWKRVCSQDFKETLQSTPKVSKE